MKLLISFVFLSLLLSCTRSNTLEWVAIQIDSNDMQGDAHLITQRGFNVLIDTAAAPQTEAKVIPYLRRRGIKTIHHLVISHFHVDHMQGLFPLLKSGIKVLEISVMIPSRELCKREPWGCFMIDYDLFPKMAKKHGIKINTISPGQKIAFPGKATLTALVAFNEKNSPINQASINDLSNVLRLEFGSFRALFTGDLGSKMGNYLVGAKADLRADIIKVPHHGAKDLPGRSFFKHVGAKVAIVPSFPRLWCSGKSKGFRKQSKGLFKKTFVNGFHGHVTVKSDGNTWKISTERSKLVQC